LPAQEASGFGKHRMRTESVITPRSELSKGHGGFRTAGDIEQASLRRKVRLGFNLAQQEQSEIGRVQAIANLLT